MKQNSKLADGASVSVSLPSQLRWRCPGTNAVNIGNVSTDSSLW